MRLDPSDLSRVTPSRPARERFALEQSRFINTQTLSHLRLGTKTPRENSARSWSLTGMNSSNQTIIDHFQCPEEYVHTSVQGRLSECPGFFKFGPALVCYGRCSAFVPSSNLQFPLKDARAHIGNDDEGIQLSFDIAELISNLRFERYVHNVSKTTSTGGGQQLKRLVYYTARPIMPVLVRKHLQRYSLRNWDKRKFPSWPIDTTVEGILEETMRLNLKAQGLKEVPFIWFWPDGAQACAVITHDVETRVGRDFCDQLMDIDDSFGIKSSFQIVPVRRYAVPEDYLKNLRKRGFEINVHDLNHDGRLFQNYEKFRRRSVQINLYGKKFGAKGFRSGALYRNVSWFDLLEFEYDMSVPTSALLDPQYGGCCTIFPYYVGKLLEIPTTMTQDYSLFNILREYSLDLWDKQIRLVLEKHGVMNFIIHPDYIIREREQGVYKALLHRLSELRESAGLWITLPSDLNKWWRQRNRMKLVRNDGRWEILGEGSDRARIAYARLENSALALSV